MTLDPRPLRPMKDQDPEMNVYTCDKMNVDTCDKMNVYTFDKMNIYT